MDQRTAQDIVVGIIEEENEGLQSSAPVQQNSIQNYPPSLSLSLSSFLPLLPRHSYSDRRLKLFEAEDCVQPNWISEPQTGAREGIGWGGHPRASNKTIDVTATQTSFVPGPEPVG